MSPTRNSNSEPNYRILRKIYDTTMAILFLGMGILMFFGPRFGIEQIASMGDSFRYLFGAICIAYGIFRGYRSYKV